MDKKRGTLFDITDELDEFEGSAFVRVVSNITERDDYETVAFRDLDGRSYRALIDGAGDFQIPLGVIPRSQLVRSARAYEEFDGTLKGANLYVEKCNNHDGMSRVRI